MTKVECIFIEKLPLKLIYKQGTDECLDLEGIIVTGVLDDSTHKIFNFEIRDIEILQNIDFNISGLQNIIIQAGKKTTSFDVYVLP